jgi:REP element-mobilizing transposase RayT
VGTKGWHQRGYLPHYDGYELSQHVAFRLHDAVPSGEQEGDDVLDRHLGCALLRDAACAQIVMDALKHHDAERYLLQAWCVMPNHVHVLMATNKSHTLGSIVRSWKAYSAAQINRMLGRRGRLWAADYFDRYIRNDAQFDRAKQYIEMNPVTAGLCDEPSAWSFSSAAERERNG